MSGLQNRADDRSINGVDVREQGNALRVATNTPHLVSLGTGRLSTAVTLHPIKQGRVTIGSDPTCDIYVAGTGVCSLHCRVENSHGVVTLYPINGSTLLDGLLVDKPTRLSQGSMLTIGRSNYLRFNHPEEAKLMKSVLPGGHISMAPIQFTPNEECAIPPQTGYGQHHNDNLTMSMHCYQSESFQQKIFKDGSLNALNQELDMTLKEMNRRKPPVAPRKPYRDLDQISDSNSDQESLKSFSNKSTPPKTSSIMAKVSKFEYYAKSQQKNLGRSQFYMSHNEHNLEYSPKVFSANSLTVNTPAKDVLGGKNTPTNYINKTHNKLAPEKNPKTVTLKENNAVDARSCSYANVMIKNKISRIEDIVKNFDEKPLRNGDINNTPQLKKVQNDEQNRGEHLNRNTEPTYGRIGDFRHEQQQQKVTQPSPSFDRNPQFSPTYSNPSHTDRTTEAENMRMQAYQERIKDEEQNEAENARLEEILNMCAEYERQISSGMPLTPTEKRSQNKIITNGSLPRSIGLNNPNFVQTSEGYFKFDTSQNRYHTNSMSKSLPLQRNLSNYENIDTQRLSPPTHLDLQKTPEVTIRHQSNYENVGSMDEIGIPISENYSPRNFPITELSSPIMIRKMHDRNTTVVEMPKIPVNIPSNSPIGSPYENVLYNSRANATSYANFKPKSPNTQSPRTRIKTTFAHRNLPSPQYFIFPTPPPIEDNSKMIPYDLKGIPIKQNESSNSSNLDTITNNGSYVTENNFDESNVNYKQVIDNKSDDNIKQFSNDKCSGIERQLSLTEEIPMIDDSEVSNDLEFRFSQLNPDLSKEPDLLNFTEDAESIEQSEERHLVLPLSNDDDKIVKSKSFEDVRNELMADIPELDEFERDLDDKKREELLKNITDDIKNMDVECKIDKGSPLLEVSSENLDDLKAKYDELRETRRKILIEIREYKNQMSEIRSQEDDILRELEMEKALIKGEYDSEIAILNIEQQKKTGLQDKARKFEEDLMKLKEKQDIRQNELKDRVEIATLKVERIENDLRVDTATIDELQNAQDVLDNETKIFEDLEFQHLEEESEMLAYREDLQNEIIALSKKIEAQKTRILTLKSEANSNLTSALDETKVLQADYVRILNKVEGMTSDVQFIEKQLKDLTLKLSNFERPQSPESFDSIENVQSRAKSGEFESSPTNSSDSDDLDLSKISNYSSHRKQLNDKFNSIDQMSQSMIVDLGEKRDILDLIDDVTMNKDVDLPINSQDNAISFENPLKLERFSESPSKSSTSSKDKKGFWERNFDSLSRLKNRDKKSKSPPPKIDIMSQSLNENMFFNNDNIESDYGNFERFNSLKSSKNKNKEKQKNNGTQVPVKSNSSSKIPTFAALGKMIRKDSFGKKPKENGINIKNKENVNKDLHTDASPDSKSKNRYVKNSKSFNSDNKYLLKSKLQVSPDKTIQENPNDPYIETDNERSSFADSLEGEIEDLPRDNKTRTFKDGTKENGALNKFNTKEMEITKDSSITKVLHRKSCGDEPGILSISNDFSKILSDSGKMPSQDDIDRISQVTINAPILSNETDMNSMGRKTFDSLMEIERKRLDMLEKQGCQVIENEREKISELKRRVQNETKKLWESERETKNELLLKHSDQNTSANDSLTYNAVNKTDLSITNSSSLKNDVSLLTNDSSVVSDYSLPARNDSSMVNWDSARSNSNYVQSDLNSESYNENLNTTRSTTNLDERPTRRE